MTRITSTWEGTLVLDLDEGYLECPAIFDIEGDEYPAEPTSWGTARGTEVEVKAELISAIIGGLTVDRATVEKIAADQIGEQENAAAEMYTEAYSAGEAA